MVKAVETTLNGEGLNVIVNNAGMYVRGQLDDVTEELMMEHYRINAMAPLLLIQVPYSICTLICIVTHTHTHRHTHTSVLRPFFRDHLGEPVPEENFWTLWYKED